jgi:hypothetical protein
VRKVAKNYPLMSSVQNSRIAAALSRFTMKLKPIVAAPV